MTVLTTNDLQSTQWAHDKLLATNANHWLPQEVPMAQDIAQWRGGALTPAEMRMVKRNLGFFSTADSLAANNIILGTLRHFKNSNIRNFLFRQAYEEGFHTESYAYIIESLGLDQGEIFNAYNEIKSIRDKDEWLLPFIEVLSDPNFKAVDTPSIQTLLKSLVAFANIMEGMFFYVGFTQMLSLGRRNLMVGASKEFQYILRDESGHCSYGIDLINTVKQQYPAIWTPELKAELTQMHVKAVDLEVAYAHDTMPEGMLGMNAGMFSEYMRFIANRRLVQIGLEEAFPGATNPFPWMSEMLDLRKEENFFEVKVTSYQQAAALAWD